MPQQNNPQNTPPQAGPYPAFQNTAGIVSSFIQPAQQLASALGIQPPQQIPPEVTPTDILQDIQKYAEKARETLERGKEEAARLVRERVEALRPEFQQIIATMHNVGGFSQEMLDRMIKNFEIIAKADSEIRLAYDQAIATGDLETARALIQTKAALYQSFVQERNLYINTMANLLNTVAQMRLFPYQEQQLQAATMVQRLQAASASIEFARQVFAPRLGKIRSEADLRPEERTFLRSFSQNLSNLLGADVNVVYRQLLGILSQKPKIGQVSTIVGDQGTMFIVIDENGQLRTWIDPSLTKTTVKSSRIGGVLFPTSFYLASTSQGLSTAGSTTPVAK
jgi:hypothetical protein